MRPRPGKRLGTLAIRVRSNQASDLDVASSFTAVGLSRVSIGPAISVIERGVAGLRSCDITATAASVCTQGWQTASTCAPGPISSKKRIR